MHSANSSDQYKRPTEKEEALLFMNWQATYLQQGLSLSLCFEETWFISLQVEYNSFRS
jgi:hypothetical protein